MPDSLYSKSYSFALDLDKKVREERGYGFLQEEFKCVTTVLQYPKTEVGQLKYFNFFNTLPAEVLIERSRMVSCLVDTLKSIERNKRQ